MATIVVLVVLTLLVVFVAQNTQAVDVRFLRLEGRTSLAVALLIAAIAGLAIASLLGTMRIWQLRRRVRRHER